MRGSRLPVLPLLLLLALPASGAGEAGSVAVSPRDTTIETGGAVSDGEGDETADPRVAEAFRAIESAWRSGDREALAAHLGRRGLGLSIDEGERLEGWFSRNQALSLIGRLLDGSEMIRFEFTRFRNLRGWAGRPNGAAAWEVRDGPEALLGRIVFVSLAREEDRWTIAELKIRNR
ncbi:MAG: hypothetical protein ABIH26_13480 [Candidatus Eisenbacteria bacterium]